MLKFKNVCIWSQVGCLDFFFWLYIQKSSIYLYEIIDLIQYKKAKK